MNPINESNFETNPFTKRFVKKCKEGEERISRENGNFKTFKCYKRCKANQMRNMGTMRCRKQKYDYDLYPSSSSFHGSNDLRKTKSFHGSNELKKTRKSRTPTLDYNIYPSSSSFHGSNELKKTRKSRTPTLDYNIYPSSSSFHGSNELKKTRKSRTPTLDYNKLRSIKNSIRTKKIELLRNQITLPKGREWFWGEDGKRKKTKSK